MTIDGKHIDPTFIEDLDVFLHGREDLTRKERIKADWAEIRKNWKKIKKAFGAGNKNENKLKACLTCDMAVYDEYLNSLVINEYDRRMSYEEFIQRRNDRKIVNENSFR